MNLIGFRPYPSASTGRPVGVGLSSVGTPTGQELYAVGGLFAGVVASALLFPIGFRSRHLFVGGALGLGAAYSLCRATLIAINANWK